MNMTRVHKEIEIIPQEISLLPDLRYQDQEEEYWKVLRSLFSRQLYPESPKSVTTVNQSLILSDSEIKITMKFQLKSSYLIIDNIKGDTKR